MARVRLNQRKLLPKKKLDVGKVSADGALQEILAPAPVLGPSSSAVTTAASSGRGRKQGRVKKRQEGDKPTSDAEDNGNGSMWSRFRKRVSSWWSDMQKKADKK